MKIKKKKIGLLLFCFLVSFILLMLFSKCSFLYSFNGWDDFNSFYTIGRGWANGLIPYKDLFEQKGPFLYLIFMISYLISPGKFTGVFIMEVIFFTFSLYYSGKIINLFLDKDNKKEEKYLILFLYGLMLTSSYSFIEGGSSEEFNLLFVTITVYYILKYLKNKNIDLVDMSYKDLVINGICCGLSILIKYTTIGLWFILMAYICLKLIFMKRYKEAFFKGGIFVLAMLVPLGIFCLYFYMEGALFDFINTYFYINIFKYSNSGNIFSNLWLSLNNIFTAVFSNLWLVIGLYIIFAYYLYKVVKDNYKITFNKEKIFIVMMILFSLVVLYYGQFFRPYAIVAMFVFVLLVIIWLDKLFYKKRIFKIGCLGYILISFLFMVDYKEMMLDKGDIVQYRFAEIINKEENPTLLQYRSIDEGFYTTVGVLPMNKYFEQVNISIVNLPESYDEQDDIIRNKRVKFVVVRKFDMEKDNSYMEINTESKKLFNERANLDFIEKYYDLVSVYENEIGYYKNCIYYLYKAKE